jgi:hypothetical protein
MRPVLTQCPTCSGGPLLSHCSPKTRTYSPTCDLVQCQVCFSFGRPDGARWWAREDEPAK